MYGKLKEYNYEMHDNELDYEMETRYKSINHNDLQYIKMYMDLHSISSIDELKELVQKYGSVARRIYGAKYKNIAIATLAYVDSEGICGATELSGTDSDELDEFLDDAIKAYLYTTETSPSLSFAGQLKYKINLYKMYLANKWK